MRLIEDRTYCMSSFLMFRSKIDKSRCFSSRFIPYYVEPSATRYPVHNAKEMFAILQEQCYQFVASKKIALALSGGIDSAILAALLPKGSMTYTFRCMPNTGNQIDETERANLYARICGHKNKLVDITWNDMQEYSVPLMKHKGAPIHSIEVQIFKAALQARQDGFDALMFGEAADSLYGGMDRALKQEWTFGDFVDLSSYVLPYKVLKEYEMILSPYSKCVTDGYVDVHKFFSTTFFRESTNSYQNACATAGISCVMPYANTILDVPLNYNLVRSGQSKYLVRELFQMLYEGLDVPSKIPMPRPMNEWLLNWDGPQRDEFWKNCTKTMTGDQKWMVWTLERFLNICDE